MPHYVFTVRKDGRPPEITDIELADLAAAKAEAAQFMGEELKEEPHDLWTDEEWQIDVTDERGLILFTVYSSAIEAAATKHQSEVR